MEEQQQQRRIQRQVLPYRATNQIFLQKEKNYIQQYSHIYLKRLLAIRPGLSAFLHETKVVPGIVDKVIALKVGEHVGVVGTIYKDQKLKPNVLDEFTNDFGAVPKPILENYCADDDALLLEDESGRCNLIGGAGVENWKEQISTLITGIVVACVGKLNEAGTFVVEKLIFPGDILPREIAPQASQENRPQEQPNKRYLLLTSGIYAGSAAENDSLDLQLILDYAAGHLNAAIGSSIARVIVAGGAVSPPPVQDAFKETTTIDAKLAVETQEILVESLRVADRWFAELAACVPIDVMPGEFDPCNTSLPQQPLHHCLFPNASRLSNNSFKCVTNPHSFVLAEDLNILGHSGQPVRDALRYMRPGTSAVDFLEWTLLKFRHLAPTAPDTLACYPFYDRDPFVIEKDNYRLVFSGGCSKFETKFTRGIRFVCIPNFRETKQIVLVDLDSPEFTASLVTFDVQF